MKQKIIALTAAAVLLATLSGCSKQKTCRCSKQKTCRCSVRGTSTVRIIKIDKGECTQLSHINYHSALDEQLTDSLICTDYEFLIDSIFND